MRRLVHKAKQTVKEHGKLFSIFVLIGLAKSVLTIAMAWLLIDIIGLSGFIGSTITTVIMFFVTYYSYVFLKVVKPRFAVYAPITITFNILQIILITLLVDYFYISGALSSAIVLTSLFFIRYVMFRKIGLI